MNKIKTADSLTIGFALFAMFFGAGNLIFPPFLGWESGGSWLIGFLCFIFIDIGMSLFAMIAIAGSGEGAEGLTGKLGNKISTVVLALNCLCIGPFVAVPRTAAITYEVGVVPNLGAINSWLFTGIFFAVAFLLSAKQSKVVDLVGKFMAPVMFVALLVMIGKGIVTPLGEIGPSAQTGSVVRNGLLSGYQTMDMMAAYIFSVAILMTIRQKGYSQQKEHSALILRGGLIATVLLVVVYGGLAYIGATMSVSVKEQLSQAQLLILLTEQLLGKPGMLLLGVIVAFACLTTAVGLLTSIASFFAEKTGVKYEVLVAVFTLVSWVISNFGTSTIISMAAPVLDLIYPVLIVLVVFGFLGRWIRSETTYRFAAFGAFAASVLLQIGNIFDIDIFANLLPLSGLGFGWIIPAGIFTALGVLKTKKI
ncbi:branched-chain amino acid transport system II carrier protein [Emergencia sp. JLR.KK010]|uniref:branched-chain amino acid transport system II carrier protein n=1 Tax=Emergencia sp. JLR.KK010 TaxID=3114296 RepID=UPI0030CFB098